MRKRNTARNERGSTIVIMAASMVFMVAMAALAIDVVVLYVVRSEAQRAADAGALAGAHQFVVSGFTSGMPVQGQLCDGSGTGLAQQAAIATAAQNLVAGQPGVVLSGDVSCDLSRVRNPRITVKVTRTSLPTFFSRIWSAQTLNTVTAIATAEAYNESGHTAPMESSCLKPFLLPNLDPRMGGTFITGGDITHPGQYPSGSIGEEFILTPATGWANKSQGVFYSVQFNTRVSCPSAGPDCVDVPPQNNYEANIQCCNADNFQCGGLYNVENYIPDGGLTSRGTQCVIHGRDWGSGADRIIPNTPLEIQAGSNNPAGISRGTPIVTSDSIVTVPLYDGLTNLYGGSSVTVIGFLQLFIESVDSTGHITAVVLNVIGCSPPNRNPITGGGISPVPVRLVQPGTGN